VYWFATTVQVHSIEWKVLRDPLCDFDHVFVFNDEIHSRAQPITNGQALFVALMTGVLIQLWCNSGVDLCS
jgi:hypothetical protein